MTENMQGHNNPQLPRYIKGGEEGEYAIPNKSATKRCANHTVKYHRGKCRMGRLLTIAKGLTFHIQLTL